MKEEQISNAAGKLLQFIGSQDKLSRKSLKDIEEGMISIILSSIDRFNKSVNLPNNLEFKNEVIRLEQCIPVPNGFFLPVYTMINSFNLDMIRSNFCSTDHEEKFILNWDAEALEEDQRNEDTYNKLGCGESSIPEYMFRATTSLLVLLRWVSPRLKAITQEQSKQAVENVTVKLIDEIEEKVGLLE